MGHGAGRLFRGGFTIIELLVVIAIIAILAGMVLSGVGVARHLAWEARCKSNLRQIYLALSLYANNNDDFVPCEPTEQNPHKGLLTAIGAYQRKELMDVMYCPQASFMEGSAQNTTKYTPTGASDTVMDSSANRAAGNISYIYWSFRANKKAGTKYWRNPEFFPRVLRINAKVPCQPTQFTFQSAAQQTMAVNSGDVATSSLWLMSDFYRQGAPFPHVRLHAGGLNVLFVDGRVDLITGSPKSNYQ